MFDQLILILNSVQAVFLILLNYWWIWAPLMLLVLYIELLEHYHKLVYIAGLKWVTIEIRVPQEAHKSLKAMEQIMAALHAIGGVKPPKNLRERWAGWKARVLEGKVRDWLVLELVGIGGEIHYYVRCKEDQRDLVTAQIYAHYPDSELTQVPDYLAQLPQQLPLPDMDVSGAELELNKDSAFPIKTYPEFEEEHAGRDDVRRIDPLAPLAEAMAAISFGEIVGIQVLIRATGDEWIKKGQKEIDKMLGVPEKPRNDMLDKTLDTIENAVGSLFGPAPAPKEEKKEGKKFNELSPGTQDVVKAIERGWSKLAFETGVRIIYIAPKDRFNAGRVGTILAAFKQFSTQALNGFKPGFQPEVRKGRNKEAKTLHNKAELFTRYKTRKFPDERKFVLNTEELTTIYHFPDIGVKTPALPRVEAKKGEAPAGLPTV